MQTGEGVMEIRLLHRQGRSIRSIAHELGVSRQTVRKYLREPDKAPVYGPRSSRPSKLDAFKPYLLERIRWRPRRRQPMTTDTAHTWSTSTTCTYHQALARSG